MKNSLRVFTIGIISLTCMSYGYAAKPIDLAQQSLATLQPFMAVKPRLTATSTKNQPSLNQLSHNVDFNQTTHIRVQETYAGYPVWGGDGIIHIPRGNSRSLTALAGTKQANNVTMDGTVYQDLSEDLANTPAYVFDATQSEKATNQAIILFQSNNGISHKISKKTAKLMVYIDKKDKAHWAYLISYFAKPARGMPSRPTYIMDAVSLEAYEQWNNLKTLDLVPGGGIGGNEGMIGKIFYDGIKGKKDHFPQLEFMRNSKTKICYLQNSFTVVKDVRNDDAIPQFKCTKTDSTHNNVYWNTLDDKVNGSYSPNNDVLYSDRLIRQLYKDWFPDLQAMLPDAEDPSKEMTVIMHVHDLNAGQNAWYLDGEMTFGDGDDEAYTSVAPSTLAHEMSHAFTEKQGADLVYENQSGALNESFSDMADKAVQYYVSGTNNWIIDDELLKVGGKPLRWMDTPEKDGLSIGHTDQFPKLDSFCKDYSKRDPITYQSCIVHLESGIFNKAFTIIVAKWGNDTKKAFEVMTHANRHYWKPNAKFADAACGVIKATKDYKYDVAAVIDAMKQVGVTPSSSC